MFITFFNCLGSEMFYVSNWSNVIKLLFQSLSTPYINRMTDCAILFNTILQTIIITCVVLLQGA
jgi:hypothetical protein